MGKPKMPTPPDPSKVAAAQTQSNQDTARYQQQLNMIGQSGPGGSIGYEQVGTWSDGTPRYQQTTSLSPEQQAIFNTNQQTQGNLANLAQQQSGRLGDLLSQGMPDAPGTPDLQTQLGDAGQIQTSLGDNDYSADRQRVEDALFSRLTPQLDRDRENLQARLAAQGVTQGSSAYSNAFADFDRNVNDARTGVVLQAGQEQNRLQQLALNAGNFANAAQNQQFGQNLAGAQFGNNALNQGFQNQQQNFMNQLGLRNQGLNEIIGLASGSQVQMPNFSGTPQTGVAGTDVAGIQQNAYNQQMSNYNAQQQQMGGLFGTIGNVAGAAMPFILSDERAKENIREIGETNDGQPIFEYNYKGSNQTQIGLMAQEVAKTKPESLVPLGGLMGVDYKSALRDA